MTDKERSDDSEAEETLTDSIGRRRYLKTTAAAAAAATGVSGRAGAATYDEIVVASNETFSKTLADGETWENKLIDITADGAGYEITATGDNWAIRNVGVRGAWDTPPDSQVFVVQVESSGATGVMENIYLGDGAAYSRSTSPYPSGFYVHYNHAGDLEVNKMYVANFTSHGMYASDPGNDDLGARGGDVRIHDSYCADLENSGFRIGTDGSYLDNCVAFRTVRGWWQYFENSTATDCDFGDNGTDVVVGDTSYAKGATATPDNTRFETYSTPNGTLDGSSAGTPQEYVPDGCPTTPEEAASGGSGGSSPTPDDVAEDFSHDDVPGTYGGDTGSFTTSTARATSDSYSLAADDDANGDHLILRDDMGTTAGNTYELDVYHQSASDADMGFLFGAQGGTSWGAYDGYMGFFDTNADEIRVDRWANGSLVASSTTALSWPLDEWLIVELDYRETDSSTITMTVSDASGSELASVSHSDTTYDSGMIGWYNYHAGSDWYADSWFAADDGGDTGSGVIDDFERSGPLDEYGGRTDLYSVETSTVYEGSQALVNDGGGYGSVVSTSGLDAYPSRGDEVYYVFDNAGDDNFVAFHLFAQSETDAPDTYSIGIGGTGTWKIWRQVDGDFQELAGQDLSSSDQISGWYRAEVRTDATTVYADLYDDADDTLLASIQADDTTYSSGGIGFRSAGNGEVWDYAVTDESNEDVVEDFERSSPLDEYGGADNLFSVETSTVFEGSQAIANTSGSFGSAVSTSGLGDYPSRGDEFHVHFNNASDDNFVATHFYAQSETDNPDCYSAGISGSGAWKLWHHSGGTVTELASQSLSSSDQTAGWYRAEIRSDSSTVYADLYDDSDTLVASVQADDTSYASGGIGFRSGGNGEVWDYVRR